VERAAHPGLPLYQRWCAQVDAVAVPLKQLQDAGIPVLWRPIRNRTARDSGGPPQGSHGAAALYRQLFDRLVDYHKLRNLVWVWNAAASGFGPNAPGAYSDFFPGLQYADALAIDVEDGNSRWRRDVELSVFGVGKVIGLASRAAFPPPRSSTSSPAGPGSCRAAATEQADALRALYASPRVLSGSN